MSTIASLSVFLKGGTGHFSKNMGKARRELAAFGKTARMVRTGIRIAGAAIAAAGVASVASWVKSTMDAIDSTAKLSDILGVNVEDLQRWRHAAGLSGVEASALDNALGKFARGIGEAKMGVKTYVESLDLLGISQAELKKMDISAAFRAAADGLATIPDAATRAMVAMRLFGRGGLGMVKMMAQGSKAMDALGARAGRVFNRLDASKVELANDAMLDLSRSVEGLSQVFVVRLAPALSQVAAQLTEIANSQATTKLLKVTERAAQLPRLLKGDFKGFLWELGVDELTNQLMAAGGKLGVKPPDLAGVKPPGSSERGQSAIATDRLTYRALGGGKGGETPGGFQETNVGLLKEQLTEAKTTNELLRQLRKLGWI